MNRLDLPNIVASRKLEKEIWVWEDFAFDGIWPRQMGLPKTLERIQPTGTKNGEYGRWIDEISK